MAVLLPSDQYWFEINFKPKHSKWLQTTISGINGKLKDIEKLVEEDADSFSERSEIYFKYRPELMKMVQNLYQSYHILSDRYDIATRALSQTHMICESFTNRSEESPSGMSDTMTPGMSDMDKKLKGMIELLEGVADSFAKRAEMYYKHRPKLMKLVEELYKAYQTLAERYDLTAKSLNQVYHTISEALLNPSPSLVSVSEPDMMTSGKLPLDDHDELQNGAIDEMPRNAHLVRRSVTFSEMDSVSEIAGMQKELSNLSNETNILKDQIDKETKRANKAEAEVINLQSAIKDLSVEKDAFEAQCQIYNAQLIQMEEALTKAEKDTKGLADGWSREVQKLTSLENENHALKRELERLKQDSEPSVVKSEKIVWMSNQDQEYDPWILKKRKEQQQQQQQHNDNDELILELRDEMEKIRLEAEDTIYVLKKEIDRLTERNLSYEIIINESESKIKKSTERNNRLESEIEFLREKLWIYLGKQERILLNTDITTTITTTNNNNTNTTNNNNRLSESFNWSDFILWMFFGRLNPLKNHLGAFFQMIVKAIITVYSKYFSKWIGKKDDILKKQLLELDVDESVKEEMQEQPEIDSIQIIS